MLRSINLKCLLILGALLASACEKEEALVSTFTVEQGFTVRSQTGGEISFAPGSYGHNSWQLISARSGSDSGLILKQINGDLMIPFKTSERFYLGLDDVSAESTGQGVGIRQVNISEPNYQDNPPRTVTESCTLTDRREVCLREPGKAERCFEEIVTRQGSREVTIRSGGNIDKIEMRLTTQSGSVLARLQFYKDNRYAFRNPGVCR